MSPFVVFWIRREIGLRAGLLVSLRLEVPAQRRLAARIGAPLELLRQLLQHFNIGGDALGLDRAAGRGEVPRRGQPQSPVAGTKRNDRLHRSFAEGACAD